MFDASDLDPAFLARVRADEPRLWPNHIRLVRLAHGTHTDELSTIDAELEVLAARRRAVLDRMATLRPRLWPESHRRHIRRAARVDERVLPPAPMDADVLVGVELRQVLVGIVRRHGEVSLRELHGLIHRYGYELGSDRPVQRLGDAAAYEERAGRLRRVARGVYGPTVDSGDPLDATTPLPWDRPDPDGPPPIDPDVAADPERWSDQRWPSEAQRGSSYLPPPVDPSQRSLGEDLTAHVTATRHRLAQLITDRHRRPQRHRPVPFTPFGPLGDDSSTNRSPGSGNDDRGGRPTPKGDVEESDDGVP